MHLADDLSFYKSKVRLIRSIYSEREIQCSATNTAPRINIASPPLSTYHTMEDEPNQTPGSGGRTVKECQDMIHKSFRTPMVKFLREHLDKAGCGIGDDFIKAVNCDEKISGGYVRGDGIMVCSNHMDIQDDVNQVLIHELIHAYDDCRAANLDWANCAHHACSEIRAGHLSGDCHYKREFLRGFMKIRGHEQECIRRRVMKSVINNPYCSETAAKDAMEAVWDVCYNDTKPFDRAP